MLIVKTQITITQTPSTTYPTRNRQLYFPYTVEFSADNGWEDLTDQAKITLPKISVKEIINEDLTISNSQVFLGSTNGQASNLGGFVDNIPQLLRGDQVQIISGYQYLVKGVIKLDTSILFQGYISKVKGGKPFVIECEDDMWKLKQTPAIGGANGVFSYKTYTVEAMLQELITNAGLPYKVNASTGTNLGIDFRVDNNTIAGVLEKLRKEVFLNSYFRLADSVGTIPELRCGSTVYPSDGFNTYNFDFQKNIISNDLDYRRMDDIVLSAIGTSTNMISTGGVTKDGIAKTKTQKLEVLCTFENGNFTSLIKAQGPNAPDFQTNNTGERHTFPFNNITDPTILIAQTKAELTKYYYTGYRGTLTTFGVPFVRMGDQVKLTDEVLPERAGTYKVKHVNYGLTVDGGLRQVIKLDYKVNITL